jgi:hypothetical protein
MKTGRDLVALATEIQARATASSDFLVDSKALVMVPAERGGVELEVPLKGLYRPTPVMHGQLADYLAIPRKYYERMAAVAPDLLAGNVNHWLGESSARRMVRTMSLPGQAPVARAFLSDRYRRFDNQDVAEAILPVLLESTDMKLVSCEVTDLRLYIKATFPSVRGEVKVGDVVEAGVSIENCEVGLGRLSVSPFLNRLVCLNGMKVNEAGVARQHVGRRLDGTEGLAVELFRDDTLAAEDAVLAMKIRDVVRGMGSRELFDRLLARMRAAAEAPPVVDPFAAVEVLAKTVGLRDGEKPSILEALIRGGDYSQWGVLNAVTAIANDCPDYDRASELEALGGAVLDLNRSQWKAVVEASPARLAA